MGFNIGSSVTAEKMRDCCWDETGDVKEEEREEKAGLEEGTKAFAAGEARRKKRKEILILGLCDSRFELTLIPSQK